MTKSLGVTSISGLACHGNITHSFPSLHSLVTPRCGHLLAINDYLNIFIKTSSLSIDSLNLSPFVTVATVQG